MRRFEHIPKFVRASLVLSDTEESPQKRSIMFHDGRWSSLIRVHPPSSEEATLVQCGYTLRRVGDDSLLERPLRSPRELKREMRFLDSLPDGIVEELWRLHRVRTKAAPHSLTPRRWQTVVELLRESPISWHWSETSYTRTLTVGADRDRQSVLVKAIVFAEPSQKSVRVAVCITGESSQTGPGATARGALLSTLKSYGFSNGFPARPTTDEDAVVVKRREFASIATAVSATSQLVNAIQFGRTGTRGPRPMRAKPARRGA